MNGQDTTHHDWDQARAFLARSLSRKLFREDRATLEDLTQEALIRLVRATRGEAIVNLEGLMATIAERTVIDFLRARRAWQKDPTIDAHENPDHPGLMISPAVDAAPGLELLQFTVLEFFQSVNSNCLELAHYYFAERNWLEVARHLGRPHTAIRKQWSRCVELLKKSAKDCQGSTWEWA